MPRTPTARELFQERRDRIRRSVALQRNNRPPVVIHMDGYCARHMGVEMSDGPKMDARYEDAGYVVYAKGSFPLVNEALGGGRSVAKFMRDLYKFPDQVHDYCAKLIKDMGDGFILSSGCSVPDLAKVETVKAVISAAAGE